MSTSRKRPGLALVEREIGLKGSFYDFVKMAWPTIEPANKYTDGWHIQAICDHLEAVYRGQIKNLVINVPPGCMKSLCTSVLFPVWCWIQNPGYKVILGSFDATLVGMKQGGQVLGLCRSKWFSERWGDRVIVKGKEPATSEFYTTANGMRFATSVGGKVIGRHCNVFVVDDPTKPQEMTDLKLAETRRWKQETTASRLLPGGSFVLIMQRLHFNDLAGLAEEENALKPGTYEFLRLPMRFEESQKCSTSLGFTDPRTEEGELLWPNFKTEETVVAQEEAMGGAGSAVVAAQLQQRPAPAKGLIFEKAWFKRWAERPDSFDYVVDSWDCTFKDTEGSDYVVGQRWARKGSHYYLLARVRGRWSFSRTLSEIRAFLSRGDLPKPLAVLVEDKANGPAVIDSLNKEIPGIVPINPEGGKAVRAQAVTSLYEAGNVWHPEAPWVDDHEAEMLKFPKGKNDDSVDAMTQALNYMRNKASSFAAAMDVMKKGDMGWLM